MWRCGQAYEWSNHYRLARKAGLSDEDAVAVRTDDPVRDLPRPAAAVVGAADEVIDLGRVTANTMVALRELFPGPLLQDFLYLVAGYRMFAIVSASTAEIHEGSEWLSDGIGPMPSGVRMAKFCPKDYFRLIIERGDHKICASRSAICF